MAIGGRLLAPWLLGASVAAACAPTPPAATRDDGPSGTITFASTTFAPGAILTQVGEGTPTTVRGDLRMPRAAPGRVPAVILLHGAGGVTPNLDDWARELSGIGVAAFSVDSFGPRGIRQTRTGETTINLLSRVADAFRALELLAAHPRVDPARIAVMGFSQGGGVVLLARHPRMQQRAAPGDRGHAFAAFVALYPALCNVTLLDEDKVSARPLRIYLGAADDQTIPAPCRAWTERMRGAGQDVVLVEYAGALHGFDNRAAAPKFEPLVVSGRNCTYVERSPGVFDVTHRDDGRVAHLGDRCIQRGITTGYDARAHERAVRDVKQFLAEALAPGGGR